MKQTSLHTSKRVRISRARQLQSLLSRLTLLHFTDETSLPPSCDDHTDIQFNCLQGREDMVKVWLRGGSASSRDNRAK